jgi:ribosome recycling factor
MNPNQAVSDTKTKLDHALDHYKDELKKLRTGRAHPGMLDNIKVEVYGQQMPLKAVGNITAPEAQLLQITPFDPSNLQAISNAIRDEQSLGLRIISQKVEDCMVASRQVRHEAFHKGVQAEKDKDIGKDERIRFEKQVDELLTKQKSEVDSLAAAKEKELMTI